MSDAVAPTTRPIRLLRRQIRSAARTTPGRFRLWSLVVTGLLAVTTVTVAGAATQMRSATRRVNTASGPVLVAIQQVTASLAEADAAATAAFLSGRDEDPEQRRLYEQAMARSTQQLADIATLAGNDPVIHDSLTRVSVQLTQYAGLVEAARASNRNGSSDANGYLTRAISVAADLAGGDLKTLATDAQANLAADEHARTRALGLAAVMLAATLSVLVVAQVFLLRSTRRILNPGLVFATVVVAAAMVWMLVASARSGSALRSARKGGYDSIVLTTDLTSAGFGAKADDTLALITGDQAHRQAADQEAQRVATAPVSDAVVDQMRRGSAQGAPGGLLGRAVAAADTARERAEVAESAVRWQQYQTTVATERTANAAAAKAIAVGPANVDFNGFNFSVEAIVGQNRDQFLAGLRRAKDVTTNLPTGVLILLIAAIGAALWGYQLRINEYR